MSRTCRALAHAAQPHAHPNSIPSPRVNIAKPYKLSGIEGGSIVETMRMKKVAWPILTSAMVRTETT